MPIYNYKVRDEDGRLIVGRIDVNNEEELRVRMESLGLILVKFSLEKRNILTEDLLKKILPITRRSVYTFTLQLANTIDTGMPLLVSLKSIGECLKGKKLGAILETIIEDLRSGSSLSESLQKHPQAFSKFYTNMIELGENSGSLPKMLYSLAEYLKREMKIRQKILSALGYPAVLAVVGMGVVFYILTYIMPQFVEIFVKEKVSLPLPTLILIGAANFLTNYWYVLLSVIIGIGVGIKALVLNPYGRLLVDRLILRSFLIGKVIKKICVKRFVDGLGLLYTSGLPMLQALDIVKSIVHNRELEGIINNLWVHVSAGKDLSSYLSLTDFFPPDILAMIKSGEQSGSLDKMLKKISDIYDDEVNNAIDGLISAFEILVIVIMGIGIGFIAMAIMFPMLTLGKVVSVR